MSLYSCGYDRSNTQYDYTAYNNEELIPENISFLDNMIITKRFKVLAESIPLLDLGIHFDVDKKLLESLFITDVTPRLLKKYISDSFTLISSAAKLLKLTKNESMSINDIKFFLISKLTQEVLNLSDVIKKEVYYILPSENITYSDNLRRTALKSLIDILNNSDRYIILMLYTIREILNLSGSINKSCNKFLVDSKTFTDILFNNIDKRVTDTITLLGTFLKSLGFSILNYLQLADIEPGEMDMDWLYSALESDPDIFSCSDDADVGVA